MKYLLNIALLTTALLALPSCANFQEDQALPATALVQPRPPQHINPNFICKDGTKFNASFSENKSLAYIAFPSEPVLELKDNKVITGFEYSKGKLLFKEYQGHITLAHMVKGKMKTSSCHKIRKKRKRQRAG
jgi:hypothetical protein